MKKQEKGTPGYLDHKKKIEILRTVVYFLIVAAIFLLGYSQTHTKKNLLTVVAVVGCLPACKALVSVITRIPYKSIDTQIAEEIAEKSTHLTALYDLVVTSTEKIMPIEAVVISGNKVFGYAPNSKVDLKYTADYIQKTLRQNNFSEATVKLFGEYKPFLARVEGLDNIAAVEKDDTSRHEAEIGRILSSISL